MRFAETLNNPKLMCKYPRALVPFVYITVVQGDLIGVTSSEESHVSLVWFNPIESR